MHNMAESGIPISCLKNISTGVLAQLGHMDHAEGKTFIIYFAPRKDQGDKLLPAIKF